MTIVIYTVATTISTICVYMTILNQLQNYNWSQSNVENIKEIIKSKNSKNDDLLNKMLGSHNFIKKIITENEKSITQTDYYSNSALGSSS